MNHEDKQSKASDIIKSHVGYSLGAALVPFPGADLLAVTAVQVNMLRQLAKLYNIGFMDALGKNIISAVVGSSAARLGASLVKAIPGVGTIIVTQLIGKGVASADRDKIFEPYVTTKATGTGLGLAIAKKLVLEHGGDLEVAPTPAPTGGARFVVVLPGEP